MHIECFSISYLQAFDLAPAIAKKTVAIALTMTVTEDVAAVARAKSNEHSVAEGVSALNKTHNNVDNMWVQLRKRQKAIIEITVNEAHSMKVGSISGARRLNARDIKEKMRAMNELALKWELSKP